MTSLARLDEDLLSLIEEVGLDALEEELARRLDGCAVVELAGLLEDWRYWAKPKQLPPEGRWLSWGFLGGRGMGKTWAVSRYVNEIVDQKRARLIGLAAQDEANCIAVQVKGENGLIATAPRHNKPVYHDSSFELIWPNGATASVRTPEVPGKIRGPEYDLFWATELQSWPKKTREEAWDMIEFATRVGNAQIVWDCSPKKNHPILKQLLAQGVANPSLHRVVRGSTYDNAANLADGYIEKIELKYKGTNRGREELLGEMLDGEDGVTVPESVIVRQQTDETGRIARRVLGVDPAYSSTSRSDTCGIVEGVLNANGHAVIVANYTDKHSAASWGDIVINAYLAGRCDCVVVETNRGGDHVAQNIRSTAAIRGISVIVLGKTKGREDAAPPHSTNVIYVREVYSRGDKAKRAEPTGTAYERGRVWHLRDAQGIKTLENTLTTWEPTPGPGGDSPGDLDATVLVCGELLGLRDDQVDAKKGFLGLSEANTSLSQTKGREPGLIVKPSHAPLVVPATASLAAFYQRRGSGRI